MIEPKRLIDPVGPKTAKIVFIHDSPNNLDIADHMPLSEDGGAGKQFAGWLRRVGINREGVYVTNLVKHSLYKDSFAPMYIDKQKHVKPTDELRAYWQMMDRELAELHPNIIVPLGREAMFYLTGKSSIEKWRGSIIADRFERKVVGTYDPQKVVYNYKNRATSIMDMKRIQTESLYPEIHLPEREYLIEPTFEQAMEFIEECRKADYVGTDIEVQWYKYVSCIGLAPTPFRAMSIPFIQNTKPYWNFPQYKAIKKALAQLLREGDIIGQNFHFDWSWLYQEGYEDINLVFDTMQAQHVAWPELPKSLAYMASIYTREPFWKDEAKEADPDNKAHTHVKDYLKYWTYNCKDAAVTRELIKPLNRELDATDQREVFDREMEYIHVFVKNTMKGWNTNNDLRKELRSGIKKETRRLMREIDRQLPDDWKCRTCKGVGTLRKKSKEKVPVPHKTTMCPECKHKPIGPDGKKAKKFVAPGCDKCQGSGKKMVLKHVMEATTCPDCKGNVRGHLNPDSSHQVKELLYEHLKMPKMYKKGAGHSLTIETLALLKLQVKKPHPILDLLLEYSARSQELKLLKAKLGLDHRMHTSLACNTNSGRLSSSASPFGHGTNLQNQKRHGRFREMYQADPGFIIVAADYEKAEAYTMGYEAADMVYINALENCPKCKGPTGIIDPNCPICHGIGRGDIHTKNATIIFQKMWEDITKDERQLGKRCAHGINYEMSAPTIVDYILKELGAKYAVSQKEAKKFRELYLGTYIGIRDLQIFIGEEVKTTRMVENSFGRKHKFLGRPDAKTCREAVAWIPQSTVADLTNRSMLRVDKHPILGPEFLLQKHDELVVQVREPGFNGNVAYDKAISDLEELMTVEITAHYSGLKYIVPVEIKTGLNLGELK